MPDTALHRAVRAGDLEGLRTALTELGSRREGLEARDDDDRTPLMCAVAHDGAASLPMTRALIASGADLCARTTTYGSTKSVLTLALYAGDPATVAAVLDAGADLHYDREGYSALIDAVTGHDIHPDPRLLDLMRLLVERGARLDDVTRYAESALRVLSRVGRFDAVDFLLKAGASESQLKWTPLHATVAFGDLDDLRMTLRMAPALEARDFWQRTALHVALLSGDVEKARLLVVAGADLRATGRCGQTALHYALSSRRIEMLRYTLAIGCPVDGTDDSGTTALMEAAELGDLPAVDALLGAGAQVDFERVWEAQPESQIPPDAMQRLIEAGGNNALRQAQDPATARRLLAAGADPQHLDYETRRGLLGLTQDPSVRLLDATAAQFERGWARRFGQANPERMDDPFWLAMIRSGINGYQALQHFRDRPHSLGDGRRGRDPIWCAQRYGQSLTFLPDGRVVQVGGEHEDSYDPDFCIYNDVFVHAPDGSIAIYGYPSEVFAPTDSHTATLVGDTIWLIGSIGYYGTRQEGLTPVYTLDTRSFRIERRHPTGEAPGWIYKHRARVRGESEIEVQGGHVHREDSKGRDPKLTGRFVLDLPSLSWRREA